MVWMSLSDGWDGEEVGEMGVSRRVSVEARMRAEVSF